MRVSDFSMLWTPKLDSVGSSYNGQLSRLQHPGHDPYAHPSVRVCLRLGTCYILVLTELQHICRMGTQGDRSLLDAWAEMRRKLSSHSARVQLYITGRQHRERSKTRKE